MRIKGDGACKMLGTKEALPQRLLPRPPTAARVLPPEYPPCCLSSASSPTPEKHSSQFSRGRTEGGGETALLWACDAAGSFHLTVHGTPESGYLSPLSLPGSLLQGCERSPLPLSHLLCPSLPPSGCSLYNPSLSFSQISKNLKS